MLAAFAGTHWWGIHAAGIAVLAFLTTTPRGLRAAYPIALASVGLAGLIEFMFRGPAGVWEGARFLLPAWGIEISALLITRFAEGWLFLDRLPRRAAWQLPAVLGWGAFALGPELSAAVGGLLDWGAREAFASYLVHVLRFGTLLGLVHAGGFDRARRIRRALQRRAARVRAASYVAWIPAFVSAQVLLRLVRRANR